MSRVAVVTGGTKGIGKAIAIELRDAGYKVAVNYLQDDASAKAFKAETGIPVFRFDVGDHKSCRNGCEVIEATVGPIDVLINNAGITRDGTISNMKIDDWNLVLRTNLTSCFNMSKAVFDGMKERNFGRIVSIGSVNGQAGQYGQVNYAAAKSGIHGFTKALAHEGAKFNITVNAVAPGYVKTDIVKAVPDVVLDKIISKIPVGRLGEAHDIARAVLFLIAEDATFVTGSTLSINGGHHMY